MAGTGTAPDVSVAAPNAVLSTIHLIDASGDLYTESVLSTTAPTLANLEAWKDTYQAATQASIWKVTQQSIWEGDADPDNATTDIRFSIADGVNLLMRNSATLQTQTPRLIAPITGVMQGNQDIPLLSATELAALIVELQVMLPSFALQSGQYTERRERRNNPRIRA